MKRRCWSNRKMNRTGGNKKHLLWNTGKSAKKDPTDWEPESSTAGKRTITCVRSKKRPTLMVKELRDWEKAKTDLVSEFFVSLSSKEDFRELLLPNCFWSKQIQASISYLAEKVYRMFLPELTNEMWIYCRNRKAQLHVMKESQVTWGKQHPKLLTGHCQSIQGWDSPARSEPSTVKATRGIKLQS